MVDSPRVTLPVRIRGKADRGVHRRIGADRAETLRIQRQPLLDTLQQVHEQQAGDVEYEHRERVACPAHVLIRVDAAKFINPILYTSADTGHAIWRIGECKRHVGAKWLHQQQQRSQI